MTSILDSVGEFAGGFVQGLTHPKGLSSNWRHGSRMFMDDNFRLAPRTRFLFYVKFEIDKTALSSPIFLAQHADEVGLLAKSADLPKMQIETTSKNQYNRRKLLYSAVSYEPITIRLHDDADGVTNALWAQYFGYYCADRHTATDNKAYKATHYRNKDDPLLSNYRYGLDNNISVPFFKSITIYSMASNRYLSYTLINPRIKSWHHGTMSHADNEMLESTMTLEYESVVYSGGDVTIFDPPGFAAAAHYDNLPSPLSVAGGGTSSILGSGGVLSGVSQVLGDLSSPDLSLGGLLRVGVKAYNTVNNASALTKAGVTSEAIKAVGNVIPTLTGEWFNPIQSATTTQATPKGL